MCVVFYGVCFNWYWNYVLNLIKRLKTPRQLIVVQIFNSKETSKWNKEKPLQFLSSKHVYQNSVQKSRRQAQRFKIPKKTLDYTAILIFLTWCLIRAKVIFRPTNTYLSRRVQFPFQYSIWSLHPNCTALYTQKDFVSKRGHLTFQGGKIMGYVRRKRIFIAKIESVRQALSIWI